MRSIEILLRRTIGLDPASLGTGAIERAVRQRAAACAFGDWRDYKTRLEASPEELQALIEAVVVPETWFLREPAAFAALVRLVHEAPFTSRRPLRILSAPCATGEEPYSIAIALLAAGVSPNVFRIEAIDINRRAIAHAQRAVYGPNAFRGASPEFRERWFTSCADGHELQAGVRSLVRFHQGNLLTPEFFGSCGAFDVIFCRNLLIYFSGEMQERLIHSMRQALAEDGLLFVGPAEAALPLGLGFTSVPMARSFAVRKTRPPFRKRVFPSLEKTGEKNSRVRGVSANSESPTGSLAGLSLARRLADRGQLTEAARVCETWLQAHEPCADAFYLLGLVRDANGDLDAAENLYRKALYLHPDHGEAIAHLALLIERRGDQDTAQVLRQRATRRKKP